MKLLFSLLGLLYAFCPYDLFPDFIIGFGWIDDLIILGLVWWYFYGRKRFSYENYYQKSREFSSEEKYDSRRTSGGEDPFTVLGVGRGASPEEIKAAYRGLASRYHPDKVSHLGEEFRELAEIRFKEIQKAYKELSPK